MSDLFHEGVPDEYIEAVGRVMVEADWHTFQILTKRSERMSNLLRTKLRFAAKKANIWWGVSVENKSYGLPRISHLLESTAAVKFLSVEPLIQDLGQFNLSGIDWMIVGGESGPGARPIDARWVRSLRKQCRDAGVRFFFKQWGGVRKHVTGRILDGRTYDEYPDRIIASVPPLELRRRLASTVQCLSNSFVPLAALAGD